MALQSAALLCSHLLAGDALASAPEADRQAGFQRAYGAAWRLEFGPRLHLAAAFAQMAMRPRSAAALMTLARLWPGLLTRGARWGGKTRIAHLPASGGLLNASPQASTRAPPIG